MHRALECIECIGCCFPLQEPSPAWKSSSSSVATSASSSSRSTSRASWSWSCHGSPSGSTSRRPPPGSPSGSSPSSPPPPWAPGHEPRFRASPTSKQSTSGWSSASFSSSHRWSNTPSSMSCHARRPNRPSRPGRSARSPTDTPRSTTRAAWALPPVQVVGSGTCPRRRLDSQTSNRWVRWEGQAVAYLGFHTGVGDFSGD